MRNDDSNDGLGLSIAMLFFWVAVAAFSLSRLPSVLAAGQWKEGYVVSMREQSVGLKYSKRRIFINVKDSYGIIEEYKFPASVSVDSLENMHGKIRFLYGSENSIIELYDGDKVIVDKKFWEREKLLYTILFSGLGAVAAIFFCVNIVIVVVIIRQRRRQKRKGEVKVPGGE